MVGRLDAGWNITQWGGMGLGDTAQEGQIVVRPWPHCPHPLGHLLLSFCPPGEAGFVQVPPAFAGSGCEQVGLASESGRGWGKGVFL